YKVMKIELEMRMHLKPTILIVEDEPSIVLLLQYNLEKANFITEVADDGEKAIEKARETDYDLIVLDLMLPKIDGIEVCKILRKDQNEVLGLEIGADDYLTNHFSLRELVARIQALLRRTNTTKMSLDILEIGDININLDTHIVYFLDEVIELTRKQYELLVFLIK